MVSPALLTVTASPTRQGKPEEDGLIAERISQERT
jgi:hypothetical protein